MKPLFLLVSCPCFPVAVALRRGGVRLEISASEKGWQMSSRTSIHPDTGCHPMFPSVTPMCSFSVGSAFTSSGPEVRPEEASHGAPAPPLTEIRVSAGAVICAC